MSEREASGHLVHFPGAGCPPVRVPRGPHLSEYLTPENSPVLFGCRTGICGTCVVTVVVLGGGTLAPPTDEEMEVLSLVCPDHRGARLACQLDLTTDVGVAPVGVPA
jgi:ferredoxin